MAPFTDAELLAFIDEALPAARSSELESVLRTDPSLRERLAGLTGQEITGLHSISAIWRRQRLSCPSREELGLHLLGALPAEQSDYIVAHVHEIGCRYCQANLEDLQSEANREDRQPRRRRYFETSAGHLRDKS